MKATGEEYSVSMPPALAAEVEAVAHEEHRPPDELVRDAVRRYLEQRTHGPAAPRKNLARFLMESPFAGAELDLERRKDYAPRLSYERVSSRHQCSLRVQPQGRTGL